MERHRSKVTSSAHRRAWETRRPERPPLFRAVHAGLETFLARAERAERAVPRFVERELRAYLRCGLLAHGFVRLRCAACGHGRLLAFSCKGRGFCPSCIGRRMADTAAHLVDRVLPTVPVRQWVVSLPHPLRYRLAYDSALSGAVLGLFLRCVFASLRRRASERPDAPSGPLRCGSVSFVQRFGDALNLNVHFHCLVIDGVYGAADGSPAGRVPRFLALPPPNDEEVARVARTFARRLERLLARRGLLAPTGADADPDPLESDAPVLAAVYDASVRGRLATGPRAGRRVQRLGDRVDVDEVPRFDGPRCASVGGVSLHADVAVPARDRARLERLCRYVARPPLATERLSQLADGRLLYRLKRRWRDGTTHVIFAPLELIEKLVALIPAPRAHAVRYHGVLAPAARGRAALVRACARSADGDPGSAATCARRAPAPDDDSQPPKARSGEPSAPPGLVPGARIGHAHGVQQANSATEHTTGQPSLDPARGRGPPVISPRPDPASRAPEPPPRVPRERRLAWAELMRRVFRIDVLECPRCGGRLKLLAAIDQPEVIERILTSLGLPPRAPPPVPPEPPDSDYPDPNLDDLPF